MIEWEENAKYYKYGKNKNCLLKAYFEKFQEGMEKILVVKENNTFLNKLLIGIFIVYISLIFIIYYY